MTHHVRSNLLGVSLLLNAVLAVWALRLWFLSPEPVSVIQETIFLTNQEPLLVSHPAPEPAMNEAVLPTWDTFAAPKLLDYAARLRAAGLPTSTLNALIGAELERRYRRALHRAFRSMDADYWDDAALSKTAEGRRQDRERVRPLGQLFEEYMTEANALAAAGALKRANPFIRPDDERTHLNFLDTEKRKRLAEMELEIEEMRQALRGQGFAETEVNRNLELRRQAHELERRQLLTGEEYEEFELRTSPHARFARQLHGFEPTPDEYRGIVRLLDAAGSQATLDDCRDEIRLLLGEQRFAEYEQARAPEFILLHRVAAACGLPPKTALDLYAQKQTAEQTAAAIRKEVNWSEEDRRDVLEELQSAAEAAFAEALGSNGWATYVRNGGTWTRKLRQLPLAPSREQ